MLTSASGSIGITDVPIKLIDTAITLYGERGLHAVSSRQIQREAGVLNEAAVRYYFGNKNGLVSACLEDIFAGYKPLFDAAWDELGDLMNSGRVRVIDVVAAFVMSFWELHLQRPAAVQMVARMIREEGAPGQAMLIDHFGEVIWRIEDALRDLLPNKSPEALRLHVFLAINNTVNGMVDQGLLEQLPDPRQPDRPFALPQDALARGFIEYLAAGLSAESVV